MYYVPAVPDQPRAGFSRCVFIWLFTVIQTLLPLDEVTTVLCHEETSPIIKQAYVHFLNNTFLETEVEVKEIHHGNSLWRILDTHMLDLHRYCSPEYDMGLLAFNNYVSGVLPTSIHLFFTHYINNTVLIMTDNNKAATILMLEALCDAFHRFTGPSVEFSCAVRTMITLITERTISAPPNLLTRAEALLEQRSLPSGTARLVLVSITVRLVLHALI